MAHRILLYDDDIDILDVCAAILKIKGYKVLCKTNCKTLLDDLTVFEPHAILMDNRLPDIGGVQAILMIKSNPQFKNTPVIFFSANSHLEELAKEAGADYMLEKPFEVADLQQLVERAVYTANTQ